jgi:hypothetical protein
MTIRESLRRRVRLLLLALLIVWLAVPSSMVVVGPDADTLAGLPWPIAACAIAFATVMFMLARVKCPLCSDSLYAVLDDVGFSRDLNTTCRCANCQGDYTQPAERDG